MVKKNKNNCLLLLLIIFITFIILYYYKNMKTINKSDFEVKYNPVTKEMINAILALLEEILLQKIL